MSFRALAMADGRWCIARMPVHKERFRRVTAPEGGVRVRPVFDDFHRLRMEGDYEYPVHRHTNYELILVERGPYRCRLNDVELVLRDGQVLVVKPGDRHQDHLRDGQRHYVVHFRLPGGDERATAPALFAAEAAPEQQIARGRHARDALLVRELRREAEEAGAHGAAVQDSLLEVLFWRTVRDLPAEGLSPAMRRLPRDEATRAQITAVFRKRLRENPTLPEMARELGLSPRHLVTLCRRLFGRAPARLFLELKVREAEARLRHRGLRVKEVSEQLGFANPYHFSRVFRRVTGRAPSQLGEPRNA